LKKLIVSKSDTLDILVAGRITAVFGIQGWVKVFSYTDQVQSLCDYRPWWVETSVGLQELEVDDYKRHGDGLLVHFKGTDDRDDAKKWCQRDIHIKKDLLPQLPPNDFYWHELEGLKVVNQFREDQIIGFVDCLLETGANDVLLVKGNDQSIDQEERLIPYSDEFVKNINLAERTVYVVWDPDF
jgi:16S rRNA processing protein RimM